MRAGFEQALLAQRGHLIGWVPVCLAVGIGWYFCQFEEPGHLTFGIFVALSVLLYVGSRFAHVAYAPLALGLVLMMAGAGLAKWRTVAVEAPVLGFRYYGPIQGRVVTIDRSASDATRLTLDRVVLENMAPDRTPKHVRVSVHGDQPLGSYQPGETLILTGHLSPPSGPAEPGGFDFQRHAWFLELGAVGYTRTPVLRLAAPTNLDFGMRVFALRMSISSAVQASLLGEAGAFAAAIMTGDRSAMNRDTLDNLRAANLAHLLAISGLHMGLLTGFIFAAIRYALVLIPGLGLIWPVKKIAAAGALITGAGYLALSGGNVATERAYIMVAVMFVAVLLDRRALTLRAVAMAAVVVLILRPEALTGPGFQMSFAATTALVAVFSWLRRFDLTAWPRWLRGVLSVVLSSFVAGLATAPFAAAHFNQIAHFGLIANLLSVPLMGVLVMPAAVLAACLAPIGLASVGLWLMGGGLKWILFVADGVAGQEGAVGHVVAPHWAVLPILAAGLLWVVLWQGRARVIGCTGVVIAAFLWHSSTRPAVLIADSGALMGVAGQDGRTLSKPKGDSFVAGIWLENDGAPVEQAEAAARAGATRHGRIAHAELGGWLIVQVSGKTALREIEGCGGADVLISNQVDASMRPCAMFDLARLRRTGALAFDLSLDGDLIVTTAHQVVGNRPWNKRQGRAEPPIMVKRQSADQ